jgi:hypothetical protein
MISTLEHVIGNGPISKRYYLGVDNPTPLAFLLKMTNACPAGHLTDNSESFCLTCQLHV